MAEILFTENRDYLVDKEGKHVHRSDLQGKVLGVLCGPHWLLMPLQNAISVIEEPYTEMIEAKKEICFIYIASDRDEHLIETLKKYGQADQLDERPDEVCFKDVLSKLPDGWLAVPLEDSQTRSKVLETYKAGIFSLAFLGADGSLHTDRGFALLEKWGAEAYPFSKERIEILEQEKKDKQKNQTVQSLLANEDRDYLIKSDSEDKVKVSDLQGKTVGIYFSAHWCPPCQRFTPMLASIYKQLKSKGENFEIVFLSSDEDQESFDNYFEEMPWLAVPYSDSKTKNLLNKWFEVEGIPTLVILGEDGKTLNEDGTELIQKFGIEAYPFTEEKLKQLKAEQEARRASQTLESLLVTPERDYVQSSYGQVKVSSLVGKTVGLYFSGHWCPPCRNFTPQLKSVYDELKCRGEEFEIIFISSDRAEEAFNEYFESMPWLALPFSDRSTKQTLSEYFEVRGIPMLVILGPDGKTITTEGRELVSTFRADGFPFTDDRIEEIQSNKKEEPESSEGCKPGCEGGICRKVDDCDTDKKEGEDAETKEGKDAAPSDGAGSGFVCEGEVCRRV